ncbi:hypothetical protein HN695_01070 [Candidatus Woesearchaeota archaeon]|jgi:hypothetical protein|nr:hypothetical protein [Candidatus Woesearchaeota archaeon]MBT5272736.1 hypothetical protein [Candidatus Woesearchaeota archaeon]MBT6040347.1 hypothetical protein [Candidatus Woesearchaeota archaeon]MBT6337019.1 hypothetical protein [Candidatus Woesearchaeota archaeon]MBT7926905.1 hypothetical protein [Candidatus Woesearchaeota archaeon]
MDVHKIPRGTSEGGAALHEGDDVGYIGPLPEVGTYGCLVRVQTDEGTTYAYKTISLEGEVALDVANGGLPETVRKALEGDLVPGTGLYMKLGSGDGLHADHLKYTARHLNNGGARSDTEVDAMFRTARDPIDAVVALTSTTRESKLYGTTVCNF